MEKLRNNRERVAPKGGATRGGHTPEFEGRVRMRWGVCVLTGVLLATMNVAGSSETNAPPAGTNATTAAASTSTNASILIMAPQTGLPGELSLSGKELKKAQEFFHNGVQMLLTKNFAAAAEEFRKAIAANPYQADSHANLAVALVKLGQATTQQNDQLKMYQEAAEHFSKAVELKPNEGKTYLLWAETLVLIGDLPLDPNLRLSCYQGALEKCRKATEVSPQDWEGYSKWASILSIKLADFAVNDGVRLNLFKEAALLYGKAAERAVYSGDLGVIYANWGSALVQASRFSTENVDKEDFLRQALDKFDRSTRAVTTNPRTWALWGSATLELAKITRSRSDYREGIDRLNTSLSFNPNDPGTLYNLACAYAQMGSRVLAIESLRKCLDLDKNYVYFNSATKDPSFADLRNDESFKNLMGTYHNYGAPTYNPPLQDTPR
jgi:tetratricopeptide (TPR) repeat protein